MPAVLQAGSLLVPDCRFSRSRGRSGLWFDVGAPQDGFFVRLFDDLSDKLDCRHNDLRRLFPGVTDNTQARACARAIAGWKPLPVPLRPAPRGRPRRRDTTH